MLPGVKKWFRDYGKGMRYAVYSGLLLGCDAKYCLLDLKEDASPQNLGIPIALGLFAGVFLSESIHSIRDTYRMRKAGKISSDSIQ